MKISSATSALLTVLVAFFLLAPSAVWAGGGDRHYKGGHYRHAPGHRVGGHYKHGHGRYRRGYSYYYNDDDDENLLIGLLLGGLVGYAIGDSRQPEVVVPAPAEPASAPAVRTYYPPEPHSGSTCLKEREYQTTVIVGGSAKRAYGTACLQADGSWTRGPAIVESYR